MVEDFPTQFSLLYQLMSISPNVAGDPVYMGVSNDFHRTYYRYINQLSTRGTSYIRRKSSIFIIYTLLYNYTLRGKYFEVQPNMSNT